MDEKLKTLADSVISRLKEITESTPAFEGATHVFHVQHHAELLTDEDRARITQLWELLNPVTRALDPNVVADEHEAVVDVVAALVQHNAHVFLDDRSAMISVLMHIHPVVSAVKKKRALAAQDAQVLHSRRESENQD